MNQNGEVSPQIRKIITIVLLGSCFISLASQTMMVTALPVIQEDLHVSLNAVQWLTTGYTLIIGIVTPLSSNMYEKFTNRHVFIGIIGTFLIGTLVGCFASNFASLLIEKRGSILGLSSLVISAAPALGPTISGLILEFLSWRWLFILVLPLMILAFIIGYLKLPNFSTPRPIKIDYISVIISLIGSGLALGSLTVFQINFWCGLVMLISGFIVIGGFVKRQLH